MHVLKEQFLEKISKNIHLDLLNKKTLTKMFEEELRRNDNIYYSNILVSCWNSLEQNTNLRIANDNLASLYFFLAKKTYQSICFLNDLNSILDSKTFQKIETGFYKSIDVKIKSKGERKVTQIYDVTKHIEWIDSLKESLGKNIKKNNILERIAVYKKGFEKQFVKKKILKNFSVDTPSYAFNNSAFNSNRTTEFDFKPVESVNNTMVTKNESSSLNVSNKINENVTEEMFVSTANTISTQENVEKNNNDTKKIHSLNNSVIVDNNKKPENYFDKDNDLVNSNLTLEDIEKKYNDDIFSLRFLNEYKNRVIESCKKVIQYQKDVINKYTEYLYNFSIVLVLMLDLIGVLFLFIYRNKRAAKTIKKNNPVCLTNQNISNPTNGVSIFDVEKGSMAEYNNSKQD